MIFFIFKCLQSLFQFSTNNVILLFYYYCYPFYLISIPNSNRTTLLSIFPLELTPSIWLSLLSNQIGQFYDCFGSYQSMLDCILLLCSQTSFIILSMDPYKSALKSNLKAAAFKNSYIRGFHNPQAIQKSKLQLESIQQSAIDDKTFKIMNDFAKPSENISIYRQTGRCYLETAGIFSCFSTRKTYQFLLNNSKFTIRSGDRVVRFVDFNVVWTSVDTKGDGLVFSFEELVGSKRQQETNKLIENINNLIKQTDGRSKKLTYLASKSPLDFFKSEHVHNSEFEKCANSCDILLFRSQHSAATVQRVFTDSEYDHVALVLRNKKNELFIYESTSDSGVGLTSWRQFIKYQWYTQIDKICWRQLNIKFSSADIEMIERFVVKTLGKQFQLNLQKLLTFKSSLQRTEEEQQNKTYFCSELAARLYKELGIISSEKSSTSYFPVDFSDKGSIKIIRQGVSLGNQKLISFDKIS